MLVEAFQFRLILNLYFELWAEVTICWCIIWRQLLVGWLTISVMQDLLGLRLIACKLPTAYGIYLWNHLQL